MRRSRPRGSTGIAWHGRRSLSANLRELEPWLYPWAVYLVRFAQNYGASVTSVRRSYLEQLQLYTAYVEGYSKYPAAPPRTEHASARPRVRPRGASQATGVPGGDVGALGRAVG